VRLVCRDQPAVVDARCLRLGVGGLLPADLVVSSPRLVAPRISGVPGDYNGLVPTDDAGRVQGARSMYAIGDMTSYPVKQGGIATQQADDVARSIAIAAGAPVPPPNGPRVLRGRVAGADPPLTLRVDLDGHGRPADDGLAEWGPEPLWWPPAKVFGRYLAPRLAVDRAGAAVLSNSPRGAADLSPAKA
jgi:sulfide:quinone oxidoreductase